MESPSPKPQAPSPRGMGLLAATATNIISMVGVGPFLTSPFMVAAMNGPHVIYPWIAGLVLALADGLVYAQLDCVGAARDDLARFLTLAPGHPSAASVQARLQELEDRRVVLN